MKDRYIIIITVADPVAPLVGAWIERSKQNITSGIDDVAPLVGAWIERRILAYLTENLMSLLL